MGEFHPQIVCQVVKSQNVWIWVSSGHQFGKLLGDLCSCLAYHSTRWLDFSHQQDTHLLKSKKNRAIKGKTKVITFLCSNCLFDVESLFP